MIDIEKLNRVFTIYEYDPITSAEDKTLKEVVENAIAQYLEKLANDNSQWGIITNAWNTIHENHILPFSEVFMKSPEQIAAYRKKMMIEERAKPIYEDYSITEADADNAFMQIHQENNVYQKHAAIIKAIRLYQILDITKKMAELDALQKQNDKDIEIENQRIKEMREREREQEKNKNDEIINAKLAEKNEVTFIGNINELSDQYEAAFGINEDSDVLNDFLDATIGRRGSEKYKITIKIEQIEKK